MNFKTLISIAGIALLFGCNESMHTSPNEALNNPAKASIQGEVTYRERMMLPPGAILTVTLEDVSKMDVASETLSRDEQVVEGGPPYAFSVPYDPALIDERRRYSLRAEIRMGEALLFTSTEQLDPFNQSQQRIEIMLFASSRKQAEKQHQQSPLADLTNTYWKLISIGENTIAMDGSQEREAFLQLATEENAIKGFSGCNHFRGTYHLAGDALHFGPTASTRKACLSGMETEAQLMLVLSSTAYYAIRGEQLTLYNQQMDAIANFKAMYFN